MPGAFFKVVVLAEQVSDYPTAAAFADDVLRGIGGTGRVPVLSPNEAGIASNVDDGSEIAEAQSAALQAYRAVRSGIGGRRGGGRRPRNRERPGRFGQRNRQRRRWRQRDRGGPHRGRAGDRRHRRPALVRPRGEKRGGGAPATTTDLAAQKVRAEVDTAANLVIELNDAEELPGFTDEATRWFREGATMFADLQDDLEEADTLAELEAVVWPKLKECTWKLRGAKAIVAGQPPPAEPAVEALIPQTTVFGTQPEMPGGPVVLGGSLPPPSASLPPPPPPAANYQQESQSPWLTKTAMVAMSMLAAQGIGNAMQTRNGRTRRPPSNDDWFGDVFGGGSSGGSRSSSGGMSRRSGGGGRSGRVGKGMGRRR